jgi:hypothetical protein
MKDTDCLFVELDNKDEVCSMESIDIFPHQVGGHHLIVKHPSRPDLIVKPFFPKETQFYEDARQDPALQQIVSKFYGEIYLPMLGSTVLRGG